MKHYMRIYKKLKVSLVKLLEHAVSTVYQILPLNNNPLINVIIYPGRKNPISTRTLIKAKTGPVKNHQVKKKNKSPFSR